MPSVTSCLRSFFKSLDLFPYSKLLRYDGADEYTTSTGGVISIGIIVIFVVLFASMGLKTVNKDIIFTTESTIFSDEPEPLTLTMNP